MITLYSITSFQGTDGLSLTPLPESAQNRRFVHLCSIAFMQHELAYYRGQH